MGEEGVEVWLIVRGGSVFEGLRVLLRGWRVTEGTIVWPPPYFMTESVKNVTMFEDTPRHATDSCLQ